MRPLPNPPLLKGQELVEKEQLLHSGGRQPGGTAGRGPRPSRAAGWETGFKGREGRGPQRCEQPVLAAGGREHHQPAGFGGPGAPVPWPAVFTWWGPLSVKTPLKRVSGLNCQQLPVPTAVLGFSSAFPNHYVLSQPFENQGRPRRQKLGTRELVWGLNPPFLLYSTILRGTGSGKDREESFG